MMKNNSKISIIVPVYGVERYLERCVNSILNQTYTEFELILVDDGSPDACPAICDQMAAKDSRIRVIHQENKGLSAARNAGLDVAGGEYIGFVDSDDFIDCRMYEILMRAMLQEKAFIAVCSYAAVDEKGGKKDETCGRIETRTMSGMDVIAKIGDADVTPYLVSWNKLYHKSIFQKLRFDEGKLNEDTRIFNSVFYQVPRVACVKDILYFYTLSENSIMRSKMSLRMLGRVEAFDVCFRFYQKKRMDELLSPTEKKFFGNLTDVYYKIPADGSRSASMKEMKRRHWEIIRILWKRRRLTLRTMIRTLLFHFLPLLYGIRVKLFDGR